MGIVNVKVLGKINEKYGGWKGFDTGEIWNGRKIISYLYEHPEYGSMNNSVCGLQCAKSNLNADRTNKSK